jgi:hypothetical protein
VATGARRGEYRVRYTIDESTRTVQVVRHQPPAGCLPLIMKSRLASIFRPELMVPVVVANVMLVSARGNNHWDTNLGAKYGVRSTELASVSDRCPMNCPITPVI